jgi:hypothetical protein
MRVRTPTLPAGRSRPSGVLSYNRSIYRGNRLALAACCIAPIAVLAPVARDLAFKIVYHAVYQPNAALIFELRPWMFELPCLTTLLLEAAGILLGLRALQRGCQYRRWAALATIANAAGIVAEVAALLVSAPMVHG